jgi:hypothetical protein
MHLIRSTKGGRELVARPPSHVAGGKDGCISYVRGFVHQGCTNGVLPLRCFSEPIDENMLGSAPSVSPYIRLSVHQLSRL